MISPKSAHRLPNPWVHDPRLQPLEEHCLNHRSAKQSWHPHIFPLPNNHPQQARPFILRFPQVPNHLRPVAVWIQQDPPQVIEQGYHCDKADIGSECHLRPRFCILCHRTFPFLLLDPLTEISGGMPDVQWFLVNKHSTLRAAWEGPVELLQDDNGISHVVVRKLNPEVGPVGRPPLASHHWAPEAHEPFGEVKPISISLPQGWGEGPKSPLIPQTHTVLSLKIRYQRPSHQQHPRLHAIHPLP